MTPPSREDENGDALPSPYLRTFICMHAKPSNTFWEELLQPMQILSCRILKANQSSRLFSALRDHSVKMSLSDIVAKRYYYSLSRMPERNLIFPAFEGKVFGLVNFRV